jgi:hypothetical protein
VIAAEVLGLIVVLAAAVYFDGRAEQGGRRQAELSRRFGHMVVSPATYAVVVRAMALLIAGVAVAAFVVTVIGGHS